MKLNTDKCDLMVLRRNSNKKVTVNVGNSVIENTEEEKLLGVVIDKQLNFETHISKLCQKAGEKLFALARISKYMDSDKLRTLMRCFVISQFQCCPLAWMFHSRYLNNKINKIHERALRIAYKDYESSFNTLLEKDTSVTIHTKNLQNLMIEMFKTKENINPPFMKELFRERKNTYNLRNNNEFMLPRAKTVAYGTETISFRGQRLWQSLPQHIKNAHSIINFKSKIKSWNGAECTCKLCRTFIPQLGFM